MKSKAYIIGLCVLIISMTPACAMEIEQDNSKYSTMDTNTFSQNNDIINIEPYALPPSTNKANTTNSPLTTNATKPPESDGITLTQIAAIAFIVSTALCLIIASTISIMSYNPDPYNYVSKLTYFIRDHPNWALLGNIIFLTANANMAITGSFLAYKALFK